MQRYSLTFSPVFGVWCLAVICWIRLALGWVVQRAAGEARRTRSGMNKPLTSQQTPSLLQRLGPLTRVPSPVAPASPTITTLVMSQMETVISSYRRGDLEWWTFTENLYWNEWVSLEEDGRTVYYRYRVHCVDHVQIAGIKPPLVWRLETIDTQNNHPWSSNQIAIVGAHDKFFLQVFQCFQGAFLRLQTIDLITMSSS